MGQLDGKGAYVVAMLGSESCRYIRQHRDDRPGERDDRPWLRDPLLSAALAATRDQAQLPDIRLRPSLSTVSLISFSIFRQTHGELAANVNMVTLDAGTWCDVRP